MQAVGLLRDVGAAPAVAGLLEREPEARVRVAALQALSALERPEDAKLFILAAEDREPEESPAADSLAEEAEQRADKRLAELKDSMSQEVAAILQKQVKTETSVASVRAEMSRLMERAIVGSRRVESEAREETLREGILRALRIMRRRQPHVTASALVERMAPSASPTLIIAELGRMRDEGLVAYEETHVRAETLISLGTGAAPDRLLHDGGPGAG